MFDILPQGLSSIILKITGQNSIEALHDAAKKGHVKRVERLLKSTLDVNASNPDGHTALHFSVHNGHYDCARYLLEHGADVNARDNKQRTPLHNASHHTRCATLLLDNNADIDAIDNEQRTPIEYAAYHGYAEPIKLLLNKGASTSPNAKRNMDCIRLLTPGMNIANLSFLGANVSNCVFIGSNYGDTRSLKWGKIRPMRHHYLEKLNATNSKKAICTPKELSAALSQGALQPEDIKQLLKRYANIIEKYNDQDASEYHALYSRTIDDILQARDALQAHINNQPHEIENNDDQQSSFSMRLNFLYRWANYIVKFIQKVMSSLYTSSTSLISMAWSSSHTEEINSPAPNRSSNSNRETFAHYYIGSISYLVNICRALKDGDVQRNREWFERGAEDAINIASIGNILASSSDMFSSKKAMLLLGLGILASKASKAGSAHLDQRMISRATVITGPQGFGMQSGEVGMPLGYPRKIGYAIYDRWPEQFDAMTDIDLRHTADTAAVLNMKFIQNKKGLYHNVPTGMIESPIYKFKTYIVEKLFNTTTQYKRRTLEERCVMSLYSRRLKRDDPINHTLTFKEGAITDNSITRTVGSLFTETGLRDSSNNHYSGFNNTNWRYYGFANTFPTADGEQQEIKSRRFTRFDPPSNYPFNPDVPDAHLSQGGFFAHANPAGRGRFASAPAITSNNPVPT